MTPGLAVADRPGSPAAAQRDSAGVVSLELEEVGAGVAHLDSAGLGEMARALALEWTRLGVVEGDRVVIYDYGASPAACLASSVVTPHLRRGAAEIVGASVLFVDGLPEMVARVSYAMERFRPRFLFARADRIPLLVAGPTAVAEALRRDCRLVAIDAPDAPADTELGRWRALWPGGVGALALAPAIRRLAGERDAGRAHLGVREPRRGEPEVKPERFLDAAEAEPRDRLEAAALRASVASVAEAARRPFYADLYRRAGVEASEIKDFASFSRAVPSFRKGDLLASMERGGGHLSGIEPIGGSQAAATCLTSGTLGTPTFATLGPGELDRGSSREVEREFWMDGMRPGMRVLAQYPGWHHLSLLDARALERLGAACILPFGTFTPRFARRTLDLIRRERPEYLLTVTMMLHAIVDVAHTEGIDLRRSFESVRYAMVVGEPVTPPQRDLLIDSLGLDDLFERGGSSDGLWGGADCPAHRGHHAWLDHHWIEVVDPASGEPVEPGRRGSVVVTNFHHDRSLFVRFDTEDLGAILPGECPCGRTHPRFELYGRLADCVEVDGRLVAPYDVRSAVDELDGMVGVPLVVERRLDSDGPLRVVVDSAARRDGTARLVEHHLAGRLDVGVEVGFAKGLPRRWKARTVRSPRSAGGRRAAPGERASGEKGGRWARRSR